MTVPSLILASASPRRRRLLEWAGVTFTVQASEEEEPSIPGESPSDSASRLARIKAECVSERFPDRFVLSADTVVGIDGWIMGKPEHREDALAMLRALSGRSHRVITGFCLARRDQGVMVVRHVTTQVIFRTLSLGAMERYVDSGEVWDKAGAYGIQGRGASLVAEVHGSYTNVIGLPLDEVLRVLAEYQLFDPLE